MPNVCWSLSASSLQALSCFKNYSMLINFTLKHGHNIDQKLFYTIGEQTFTPPKAQDIVKTV